MTVNLGHVREEEQRRRMQKALVEGYCPFCVERFEEIHGLPVAHSEYWMTTDNAFPYPGATIHKMLVYRPAHITRIEEIVPRAWIELGSILSELTQDLDSGSIYVRFGETAKTGSSVEHLHVNLIIGNASASDPEDEREALRVKLGYKKKTPDA